MLGGTTIANGPGAPLAWSTAIVPHTCGPTSSPASNTLELRCASNNNRAAHFQFDNFDLYPLEALS